MSSSNQIVQICLAPSLIVRRSFAELMSQTEQFAQLVKEHNEAIQTTALTCLKEMKNHWCSQCKIMTPESELTLIYLEGTKFIRKGVQISTSELHRVCPRCLKHARDFDPLKACIWVGWQKIEIFPVADGMVYRDDANKFPIPADAQQILMNQRVSLTILDVFGLPHFMIMQPPTLVEMSSNARRTSKTQAAE